MAASMFPYAVSRVMVTRDYSADEKDLKRPFVVFAECEDPRQNLCVTACSTLEEAREEGRAWAYTAGGVSCNEDV